MNCACYCVGCPVQRKCEASAGGGGSSPSPSPARYNEGMRRTWWIVIIVGLAGCGQPVHPSKTPPSADDERVTQLGLARASFGYVPIRQEPGAQPSGYEYLFRGRHGYMLFPSGSAQMRFFYNSGFTVFMDVRQKDGTVKRAWEMQLRELSNSERVAPGTFAAFLKNQGLAFVGKVPVEAARVQSFAAYTFDWRHVDEAFLAWNIDKDGSETQKTRVLADLGNSELWPNTPVGYPVTAVERAEMRSVVKP